MSQTLIVLVKIYIFSKLQNRPQFLAAEHTDDCEITVRIFVPKVLTIIIHCKEPKETTAAVTQ